MIKLEDFFQTVVHEKGVQYSMRSVGGVLISLSWALSPEVEVVSKSRFTIRK